MKITILGSIFVIIATLVQPLYAAATEPFSCDGRLYQSIYTAGNGLILYEIDTNPVAFREIANLSNNGLLGAANANALAYNPVDDFLYMSAVTGGALHVYRIDKNGSIDDMGAPLFGGLTISDTVNAGAFLFNGTYLIAKGTGQIWAIDLDTMTGVELTGTYTGTIPDIAVDPISGQVYGWNQGGRILSRIDLDDLNNPTAITATTNIGAGNANYSTMGAAYFTASGEMIAYGNDVTDTAAGQETLVSIDVSTGVLTELGTGPTASGNDGASCPYGIDLEKNASTTLVNLGDVYTYTFVVSNSSSVVLNNIIFSDTLVDGFLWNSEPYNLTGGIALGATSLAGNADANFNISTLPLGTSSFDIDVLVPAAVTDTQYSNLALLNNLPSALGVTITSDDAATITIDDSTVITVNAPDLVFEQFAAFAPGGDVDSSGTFTPGDIVEYTITLTNNGPVAATDVSVINAIPADLTYTPGSITGGDSSDDIDPSGTGLGWTFALLAGSGTTATMTYHAEIQVGATGVINVQATANGTNLSGSKLSDAADVSIIQNVSSIIDADGSGDFTQGDTVEFSLTATNNGTVNAENLTISNALDDALNYVSASISGGDSNNDLDPNNSIGGSPEGLEWIINNLLPGGGNTQTLTYQAVIDSGLDNTGGVVSSATLIEAAGLAFNDLAEPTPIQVTAPPVITLSKTASLITDADASGSITPGDALRYTLTASVAGATANNLTIYDPIPSGTSYVFDSISTASSDAVDQSDPHNLVTGPPEGLQWTINSLAAGDSAVLTFEVTVDDISGSILSNQGFITGNFNGIIASDDPGVGGTADPTNTLVDDLPTAIDDTRITSVGTGISINVLSNDIDLGDGLASLSLPSATSTLGVTISVNNASTPGNPTDDYIDYAAPVAAGVDTFNYTITDIDGDTSTATVTVNIDAPNMSIAVGKDGSLIPTGLAADNDTSGTITEGDVIRFVTTVVNGTGGVTATNVQISEILPIGYLSLSNVLVSSSGTVGAITNNSTASGLDIDIATMDADSSITISYEVTINVSTAGTQIINTAQVSGSNFLTLSDDDSTDIQAIPLLLDLTTAIDENTTNGTPVINIDEANTGTDIDVDGDVLSYSITGGNTNNAFAINSATGLITVNNTSALDYESLNAYTLTIEAADGSHISTATITININDLLEAVTAPSDGTLKTALNGAGSIGGLTLLILLLPLLWVRRHKVLGALSFILLLTPIGNLKADTSCLFDGDNFSSCWYIGAGLGVSSLNPDDSESSWKVTDKKSNGGLFYVGNRFKEKWFAELSVAQLGSAKLENEDPSVSSTEEIDYLIPSLMVGYNLFNPSNRFNIYGKAGIGTIQNTVSNNSIAYEEVTSAQLAFGAGASWQLSRHWGLRIDANSYDKDAQFVNLSLAYFFNNKSDASTASVASVSLTDETTSKPEQFISIIESDCRIFSAPLDGVKFEVSSAVLTESSYTALDDAAEIIRKYPELDVLIEGHASTDGPGLRNYNLSRDRAISVMNYFIKKGVQPGRLSVEYYGELLPVFDPAGTEDRDESRRVELSPQQITNCPNTK